MDRRKFPIIFSIALLANLILILQVAGWERKIDSSLREIPLKCLQNGDVVLRCGNGLVSELFRKTGRKDPRFSHAGILILKDDVAWVLHMDQEQEVGLHLEKLSSFIHPAIASGAAIYRMNLNPVDQKKLMQEIRSDWKRKPTFDAAFDLKDANSVYCTEWVNSVYSRATGSVSYFPVTTAGDFNYIAPENLYMHRQSRLISNFDE